MLLLLCQLAISSLSNHFKTFPAPECPWLPLCMQGPVNGLVFETGPYKILTCTQGCSIVGENGMYCMGKGHWNTREDLKIQA